MGCYNSSGFISKLPIRYADRVVCFIGLVEDNFSGHEMFNPDSLVSPIFLPIRGIYDDYGSVDIIDETPIVKFYEKYSGMKIGELFRTCERCIYGHTINDNIKHFQKYPEKAEPYIKLKKFLTNAGYIGNIRPVLMLEHESVYDKITENFVQAGYLGYSITPEQRFNEFYSILDEFSSIYKDFKKRIDDDPDIKKAFFKLIPKPMDIGYKYAFSSLSSKFDKEGDEDISSRIEALEDRYYKLNNLFGVNVPGGSLYMFNILENNNELLDAYNKCKDELRQFYNLWYVFSMAPMYFGLSQTAGMQEFESELIELVYNACNDELQHLLNEE